MGVWAEKQKQVTERGGGRDRINTKLFHDFFVVHRLTNINVAEVYAQQDPSLQGNFLLVYMCIDSVFPYNAKMNACKLEENEMKQSYY
jgi:hypothetical protein